jgi:hypothetical protein
MDIRRTAICLQAGLVLGTYFVLFLLALTLPRTTYDWGSNRTIVATLGIPASVGFLAGIGLMLKERDKWESLALAASTIAAFVLLLLVL